MPNLLGIDEVASGLGERKFFRPSERDAEEGTAVLDSRTWRRAQRVRAGPPVGPHAVLRREVEHRAGGVWVTRRYPWHNLPRERKGA